MLGEGLRRLPVAPAGAGYQLVQGFVLFSDATSEVQVAALQATVVGVELAPWLLSREVASVTPEAHLRLAVEVLEGCLDPACDLDHLDRRLDEQPAGMYLGVAFGPRRPEALEAVGDQVSQIPVVLQGPFRHLQRPLF